MIIPPNTYNCNEMALDRMLFSPREHDILIKLNYTGKKEEREWKSSYIAAVMLRQQEEERQGKN